MEKISNLIASGLKKNMTAKMTVSGF